MIAERDLASFIIITTIIISGERDNKSAETDSSGFLLASFIHPVNFPHNV